ncbi:MAG TPA: histidine phosphatase family protein [Miltoncostaea sp.]|nr:histidine phosphatase family protein [Miltoncostaea sp.]
MRLILVRHGLSEWNASGRVQGQADPPLAPEGREEARRLAPLVLAERPEAVVSSDLARARETAELLGAGAVETDARWRESAMGDWTGRPAAELMAEPSGAFARWREGLERPPGGESFDDMRARAGAAVRDLLARGLRCVVVVTHGGPVRAAVAELAGLAPLSLVPVPNACMTVVDTDGGRIGAFAVRPPSLARARADA